MEDYKKDNDSIIVEKKCLIFFVFYSFLYILMRNPFKKKSFEKRKFFTKNNIRLKWFGPPLFRSLLLHSTNRLTYLLTYQTRYGKKL